MARQEKFNKVRYDNFLKSEPTMTTDTSAYNNNEILKQAIEQAIEKMEEHKEPSESQIAFKNGYGFAVNRFMWIIKQYSKIEQENEKLKGIINKAINCINDPWSVESGNKEVDEITHKKKMEAIAILRGEK